MRCVVVMILRIRRMRLQLFSFSSFFFFFSLKLFIILTVGEMLRRIRLFPFRLIFFLSFSILSNVLDILYE